MMERRSVEIRVMRVSPQVSPRVDQLANQLANQRVSQRADQRVSRSRLPSVCGVKMASVMNLMHVRSGLT